MDTAPLFIGIDAGGTTTRLLAQSTDGTVRQAAGPGAQLQRHGVRNAAQVLSDLIHEALQDITAPRIQAIVAGVAGAGDSVDQLALEKALADRPGMQAPQQIHVVQDAEIALEGAFEGDSGMIIIAGTGSIVVARGHDGSYYRVGGWGYLLGDEGSGLVLGLAGLRAVGHALDGHPRTILQDLVAERFGIRDRKTLVRRVYQSDWPVQQVAPLILQAAEEGDDVAQRLMREQTHALAEQGNRLIGRHPDIEPRFALLGGLNESTLYRTALGRALCHVLPGWKEESPRQPPVRGALLMAQRST